jgi:hypothetical protein
MLSEGMTQQEILEDFPELELADILAVLSFAADREHGFAPALQDHGYQLVNRLPFSEHPR